MCMTDWTSCPSRSGCTEGEEAPEEPTQTDIGKFVLKNKKLLNIDLNSENFEILIFKKCSKNVR